MQGEAYLLTLYILFYPWPNALRHLGTLLSTENIVPSSYDGGPRYSWKISINILVFLLRVWPMRTSLSTLGLCTLKADF